MALDGTQGTQKATQQATQPYDDPKRRGKTLSEMSENDVADVICTLHCNTPLANEAARATMLRSPEHILQNEDLDGITEDDLLHYPDIENRTREFALRMSSTVKIPKDGFRFGRNPAACDILLTPNLHDKLISNVHFKIFVHEQGSLMIQDASTNGTIVDGETLRSKDKYNRPLPKPAKRVLTNGSFISVIGTDKKEVKFMVRIPPRDEYQTMYEEKLRRYLAVRGITANFKTTRESSFGNQWTGGNMYNFTGLIGKGAFASVYRIQTKDEGTIFAAKELDKRRFVKNGILDIKFDNELKIMQRLKHPNIVEYIQCETHQNWIYIIMEYVPHGELSQELATRTKLPESEVQQITIQTLRALDYLHRQGVTHRDIKPDNILIASRDPLVIKLADFGLSKSVVDQETFLKTFCGTLLYCAPEVYPDYNTYTASPAQKRRRHGENTRTSPYDSSADMWSFGAVIYHLLCGRAPIIGRGDNRGAQMLSNIMTKDVDFEPLREIGISEAAIDFVRGLLNRNPLSRATEEECFSHPWLRQVGEFVDYSGVSFIDVRELLRKDLEAEFGTGFGEEEDDEDLINDLNQLTQNPGIMAQGPPSTPSSPERMPKKPKMTRTESTIPEQILYPMLPPGSQDAPSRQKTEPRLFGEITQSLLKSSGLFGMDAAPVMEAEVPQIREKLEQVSMNDFASTDETNKDAESRTLVKNTNITHMLAAPRTVAGSAASLLGAEEQMGQMNMGSPGATNCDGGTPGTNSSLTPNTRAITPNSEVAARPDCDSEVFAHGQNSEEPADIRHIDFQALSDEAAFADQQRARHAARLENARVKAETFHIPTKLVKSTRANQLAQTFNGIPQQPTMSLREPDDDVLKSRFITLPEIAPGSVEKITTFGMLRPLPGSFSNVSIPLLTRSTLWGRGDGCTHRYADLRDTRVPKYGLKIMFYASGIEQLEEQGQDWTKANNIRTIIATSASRGIKINDITLAQQSEDGLASLFGTLYNGDVITVVDNHKTGEFLKYEVEITFGESAKQRPDGDTPFRIQKEYKFHAQMKEQSVYVDGAASRNFGHGSDAGSTAIQVS